MFELIGQLNNEVNKNWCPLLINPQYAMEWAVLSTFNFQLFKVSAMVNS